VRRVNPNLKRILFPYDFDEVSDTALAFAKGLARTLGATITLIHVCEVRVYGHRRDDLPVPDVFEQLAATATEALQKLTDASKDFPLTFVVRRGAPWEAIRDEADPARYDLVIIGSHSRRGLASVFVGSVAERVVHTAKLPTLLLPAA
jgi:nucleotide-binding universal stress UspA family protein